MTLDANVIFRVLPYENENVSGEMRVQITYEQIIVRGFFPLTYLHRV